MERFTLVIFGITSNLAQIKLIPTLYDLVSDHKIGPDFTIIGVGRTPMDKSAFNAYISKTLRSPNRHHTHTIDEAIEQNLLAHMEYLPADLTNPKSFETLKQMIVDSPNSLNRMSYLATFPSLYGSIFENLKKVKLTGQKNGWTRIVIEKPIGHDRDSARALNDLLAEYFTEDQIFRLDHYLGKETFQKILDFRFKDEVVEPQMNAKFIDHIQVTAAEDFGIGLRGSYYDQAGAFKDVGQNHLLQMIALATMNKPQELTGQHMTQERVNILKNLIPEPDSLIFGQYENYRSEKSMAPESNTETYFAFRTHLDNDRFQGVPIYVRGGKYLTKTATEISIIFKDKSVLTYRLGDHGGISLKNADGSVIEYMKPAEGDSADAYEKLLEDALLGDQTFFNDTPEVDAQWAFTDALLSHMHGKTPIIYPRGSWGPREADELIKKDGRVWLI
jgi:glucose-6-phosphate 1-dehydrogenase